MKLQLLDDNGKPLMEYDLGTAEGEWNILSEHEAGQLLSELQREVEAEAPRCAECGRPEDACSPDPCEAVQRDRRS